MASTRTVTPIDLSDPARPQQLSDPWRRTIHGCSIGDDGRRGYFQDASNGQMLVVDTSEVQAHRRGARLREISSLSTPGNRIKQSTIPVSYRGVPYLVDFSEGVTPLQGSSESPPPPAPCTPGVQQESNFG